MQSVKNIREANLLVDSERLYTQMFFRIHGDWFEQQLPREDILEVQCDDAVWA